MKIRILIPFEWKGKNYCKGDIISLQKSMLQELVIHLYLVYAKPGGYVEKFLEKEE